MTDEPRLQTREQMLLSQRPESEPAQPAESPEARAFRDQVVALFSEGAKSIYDMRDASPFHSVSQDALTTYARNLEGWARQIEDMPLPAATTARPTERGAVEDYNGHTPNEYIPRLPAGCGLFAVNKSNGDFHYINHAGTWQGMPSLQPATDQAAEVEARALIKRMADRETDGGGCLDIVSWLLEADRIAALQNGGER